jgi:hypothetical protein
MIIALLVLTSACFIALGVLIYLVLRLSKHIKVYISYVNGKSEDLEKNLNTLGRVMLVYEEATQILKRRNEAAQLTERFHRTPR